MRNAKAILYVSEIMEMRRASYIIQDEDNKIINETDFEKEYDILNLSSKDFKEYYEKIMLTCKMECWNEYYDNKTSSGEHWIIKIIYDNNEERKIEGYNSYPEEYEYFLKISNEYL